MFLGSAAAVGIGSLEAAIDGGTIVLAQGPGDPVYGEVVDQLLGAVRKLQDAPTGEASRKIASSLRLLAVWGRANKVDDTIRKSLRAAVRKKGRSALLAQPFDIDAELKLRGWRVPPGTAVLTTPVDLSDSLDDMLQHGITGHWADYAKAFESAAAGIDKKIGRPALIANQGDPSACYGMHYMQLMLATQVFLACSLGLAMGPEFCVIASGLLLSWQWYTWYQGC